ncbi:MAG: sulfatase [Deltaproteobacteria bacterium]|nr:sulfatase [Deltaproteobacteria bacterium]
MDFSADESDTKAPQLRVLIYALLLGGPFFVVLLAAKAAKVLALVEVDYVSGIVASSYQDLLIAGIVLPFLGILLGMVLPSAEKKATKLSISMLVLLHALFVSLTFSAVVEHVFFIVTGAVLDGYIFLVSLHNAARNIEIMQSELNFGRTLAFLLPFIVTLLPVFVWRKTLSLSTRTGTWRLVYGVPLALLVVSLMGLMITPPSVLNPVNDNVFIGLAKDALGTDAWQVSPSKTTGRTLREGPKKLKNRGEEQAKNVIVIVLESTAASQTSLYNSERSNTPFLKSLGRQGAVVTHGYTSVPHTTKALVSVHCGIYPWLTPSTEEAKFGAIPTACMAKLLKEQGFATAYFQSAEENYERRADLVREFGFETFIGKESIPAYDKDGSPFDEASYFGWEDDAMVPPVLDFIDAHRNERFFISLLTLTAHHPYSIPARHRKKKLAPGRAFNDYLNSIAYVDGTMEKLFKGLEERGVLKDTAVIILGDHGEGFGEHGRSQHDATIFEEGIHIPFVLVGAGVEPGQEISGLRQNIDVLPTAVELLGLAPFGGQFEGKSLLSTPGHDAITVWCHYRNYCSARLENRKEPDGKDSILKTIYHYKKRNPQVFYITDDPLEKRDLIGKTESEKSEVQSRIDDMISLRVRNNRRYSQRTKTRIERYVTQVKDEAEVNALLTGPRNEEGTRKLMDVNIKLDDFVTILGFQQSTDVIEAGDQLVLTTWYWVHKRPGAGWRTFHHISGPQRMNGDHTPVEGAYKVARWKAGQVIEDHMIVSTRPDTIPGTYNVMTGMWNRGQKGRRANALINGKQVHPQNEVKAPSFRIIRPRVDSSKFVFDAKPALVDQMQPDGQLDLAMGPHIRLRALGIEKPITKGGLKTTLIYVYEVLSAPGATDAYVDILGPSKIARLKHIPVSGTWPTKNWKPGQWIVDRHEIITHTRHRLGKYDVMLGFKSLGRDGKDLIPAGDDAHRVEKNRLFVGSYQLAR